MCSSPPATRCMPSAFSGSSSIVGVLVVLIVGVCRGGPLDSAARLGLKTAPYTSAEPRPVRAMTLAEALPALHALDDRAPEELRASQLTEATWSKWIAQRDVDIRSRLDKGDEDSVINLMLYGTTFTRQPRATPDDLGSPGKKRVDVDDVMEGRLTDLVKAIESPGNDERLQFARHIVERHGIAVGLQSRGETRKYLQVLRSRVLAENKKYADRLSPVALASDAERRESAATVYRDRGLSSDTSLRVNFALDQALTALRNRRKFARRAMDHVAVIGPGLDFVDKAQGYDFSPVQMIQPFAIVDSLRRLGLASQPSVMAFDINPRVLSHLNQIQQRASGNESYRLNLVLEQNARTTQIDPKLIEYWEHFGAQIGEAIPAEVPNTFATRVRARALAVRPAVVRNITGQDLDVVVGRLASAPDGGFDAIVATNVLVYYEPFEQALAVANMASMLTPGGVLLTSQPLPLPETAGLSATLIVSVDFDRVITATGSHQRGDSIYAYTKK